MPQAAQMIEARPGGPEVSPAQLANCIEECFTCAQVCTACADACLGEEMVAELAVCIRADLACADLCLATGKILSRGTGADTTVTKALLEACALACRRCGDECARHAEQHEHCRICAEACRRCEQACRDLQAALG